MSAEPEPARVTPELALAAARAEATLRRSLSAGLVPEVALRIAHARTLAMLGDLDRVMALLGDGEAAEAIELMHLLYAAERVDDAIAVGLRAAERFPARASGFRNSAAGMLSELGRHLDALQAIEANLAAEPDVPLWHELRQLLVERMAEDEP